MKRGLLFIVVCLFGSWASAQQLPKIYIAFQWHMHQPIYIPGETMLETYEGNTLSYNLLETFTSRTHAYTTSPAGAVQKLIDAGLPGGAQISFSGSLVENLNVIEGAGLGFGQWKKSWKEAVSKKTSLGNQRVDMVAFGYHHPVMPLIDHEDVRKQIQRHKACFSENFPGMPYSKGIFPPENAFEQHLIPALVQEGIEWAFVDNSHFDRTCKEFPWVKGVGMVEPNRADWINPNPDDWTGIAHLYCPGKISAAWGHRPHWMKYVDPKDGKEYRMIAVPTSLVFGNEDGRGGFGALQYELCLSQLERFNTDAQHPILVVMHHDGDNYGGGTDSYYGSNFSNLVSWLKRNTDRFACTTVQDYLTQFPPAADDLIHVEPGSWWGAGADPEFQKWNGDKGKYMQTTDNYSPDHNSWGVITAASNIVKTAQQMHPADSRVRQAWEYLMVGQTSCYWYWDGTESWDSHPSRAANLALTQVLSMVQAGDDKTPPSIYHPQREPYNPGGTEWGISMTADFTVWTYVFDSSGLASVKLKYRTDRDGKNPLSSNQNETYVGGNEVNDWQEIVMTGVEIESITHPKPAYKALEYSAKVSGLKDVLVDYYVEATDRKGNVARSILLHVWVGTNSDSGGDGGEGEEPDSMVGSYLVTPLNPTINDVITVQLPENTEGVVFHWGVDNFEKPHSVYLPAGSSYHTDNKAARTPFVQNGNGKYVVQIGPFNNPLQVVNHIRFVINHTKNNQWDNNGGSDYRIGLKKNGASIGLINKKMTLHAHYLNQKIKIKFPHENHRYEVRLYRATGLLVGQYAIQGMQTEIEEKLPTGVYLLSVRDANSGKCYSTKLVSSD